MRRKDQERLLDDFVTGVFGIAVLAGVFTWISTKSPAGGVAVFLVAVIALAAAVWLWKVRRRGRLQRTGINEIDEMSGEAFEERLLAHFSGRGCSARLTPNGNDFGADPVLERAGETTVVQAKRWQRQVGVQAVQEVVAARAHYRADRALVATNSFFTEQAIKLARSNDVELWDRDRLVHELEPTGREVAESGESVDPKSVADTTFAKVTCPRCGSPMVQRTGKYGPFWGCSAYPRCRGTRPVEV